MKRSQGFALTLVFLVLLIACKDSSTSPPPPGPTPTADEEVPAEVASLELVGHTPLLNRGMNSALAMFGNHAYVGSRTDRSKDHLRPGVLIVDISEPSDPRVVGEISTPDTPAQGETSRELRIWPQEGLLLVMSVSCREDLHDCGPARVTPAIRFFDVSGAAATKPRLVSTYYPSLEPHEFYLWQDPDDRSRVLLYLSTPYQGDNGMIVTDISRAREGIFDEIVRWGAIFPERGAGGDLHSLSLSPDGTRAYLAYLTDGFMVLDTSEVAAGHTDPELFLITDLSQRPRWPGWGAHSAVGVPGKAFALTTDEVYGGRRAIDGCPWGWVRLISISDETRPVVTSEFRLSHNQPAYCDDVEERRDRLSSFSSHNPTLTPNVAFISWHSGGLQAVDISDPSRPAQITEFLPEPLDAVATEDPALSSGPDKVVMWSYPIIKDGLIYVVDVRNGLYIFSYDGPHSDEVRNIEFLEGNSNLGLGG